MKMKICDACEGEGDVLTECPTCGESTLLDTCPICNGEGEVIDND